jgi:multiple antibiotic resistance protein
VELVTKFLGYVAGALLAILPIVNPLGAVPLVMAVGAHLPEAERRRQVRRACVYTFALMAGFLLAGGLIMSFFGISVPGMRIAGGMIVAILGFQMLFPSAPPPSRELERETGYKADIAFTPLAMPGLAGAGTFAVIMSLSSQASARPGLDRAIDFTAVLAAILIVALLSFATLRAADRLHRVLGPTGMIALTRITGFLMVCIGVQFVIDGLTAILQDPGFWSGLSRAVAGH